MSSLGKIKCDICNFISDLESSGKMLMKTPDGWANIYTMVSIMGRKKDSDNKNQNEERRELKSKLEKKFPVFHVCPGCIKGDFDINTHLSLPPGMKNVNRE